MMYVSGREGANEENKLPFYCNWRISKMMHGIYSAPIRDTSSGRKSLAYFENKDLYGNSSNIRENNNELLKACITS